MALSAAPPALADGQVTGPAGGPVAWSSGDFTITSAGTIGAAATGLAASGSALGTFTNSGQIVVTRTGVDVAAASTVSALGNYGVIQSGGSGVSFGSGAVVSALSNLAGGTIHGAQAGIANSGQAGWISNAGLIESDTTFGVANGGYLGILQNQSGGTIKADGGAGAAAIYVSGAVNTLTNAGLVTAPNAQAVIVTGGTIARFSNEAGGSIASHDTAVWNNGAIGTLSNGGTITSAAGIAIRNFVSIGTLASWGAIGGPTAIVNSGTIGALTNSGSIQAGNVAIDNPGSIGTLTNAGGGQIVANIGVRITGAATEIDNSGLIQGGVVGVSLGSGVNLSALSNLAGGTIHAAQAGLSNSGRAGWISNAGLIESDTAFALANGGYAGIVQNQAGGTIKADGAGGGAAAVYDSGTINTLSNSGLISAPSANAVVIAGGSIAQVSNAAGGRISAHDAGIWNNGSIGALANGGTITSAAGAGVRNFVAIGSLSNWGAIGGATAVSNTGGIGAVTNSGMIQAGNTGIDNAGSIGTLTNLSGGQITANTGVHVGGAVGELDNAGYISSPTRAILIESSGALPLIANTGVIQGIIENQSAHDLTITGASGSAMGALTGYAGGQGAIYNAASDLHMSGAILLDDSLFLGGHTLFSSANLTFSRSVGAQGNFNQDGGSLMFAVASPTSYAQLNFSGAAQVRIANAALGLVPASSGILAQGQSYTVVQAASGAIAIANDSVQVAGFTGALTNTGHALVLSLIGPAQTGGSSGGSGSSSGGSSSGGSPAGGSSGGSGSSSGGPSTGGSSGGSGTSPGGSSSGGSSTGSGGSSTGFAPSTPSSGGGSSGAGAAVNDLAAGSTPVAQAFNSVISPLLVGLSTADQARALTQLGPATLGVEMGLEASSPVSGAVASQQAGYVAQVQGRAYAVLDDYYGEAPVRGLWGKVLGAGAGGGAGGGAPFSAAMVGAVIGSDLIRGEQVYGGLAVSYVGDWASGKGAQSGERLRVDNYQITAYGSAAPKAFGGRLTFDAALGAGLNRYDQERGIDFLHSAARAKYDGEQYTARFTAGYAFVGRTMTIIPYVGIDETHVVQHGYTETGAGLADLHVNGLSADTFRHDIGVKLDGEYDVGGGVQMTPSLKVGWGHTYDNGPVAVYSTLAGVSFTSLAARPSADGALVGASLAFRSQGRVSMAFEYDGDLRHDFQAHTGAVRVKVRF